MFVSSFLTQLESWINTAVLLPYDALSSSASSCPSNSLVSSALHFRYHPPLPNLYPFSSSASSWICILNPHFSLRAYQAWFFSITHHHTNHWHVLLLGMIGCILMRRHAKNKRKGSKHNNYHWWLITKIKRRIEDNMKQCFTIITIFLLLLMIAYCTPLPMMLRVVLRGTPHSL